MHQVVQPLQLRHCILQRRQRPRRREDEAPRAGVVALLETAAAEPAWWACDRLQLRRALTVAPQPSGMVWAALALLLSVESSPHLADPSVETGLRRCGAAKRPP